jgi:hypothetical protein
MSVDMFGQIIVREGYDPDDEPGRFGISFNRLKELVECNPEEGWARWKVNRYSGRYHKILNASAGDFLPDPPSQASVDRKHILLHHIIWVFHTKGIWAEDETDHKNGNRCNNKIENLREATHVQII